MQSMLEKLQSYPYWRSGSIVVFILIIVGGMGVRQLYVSSQQGRQNQENASIANTQLIGNQNDRDTDEDGLSDWKEILYGTDSLDTDTDKDGTGDGEEVRLGRDPLTKGPNDVIDYLKAPGSSTSSPDIEKIRKEFFATYLAQEEQVIREKTLKDLVGRFDPSVYKAPYALKNFAILPAPSTKTVLHSYLNTFASVALRYATSTTYRNEEDILSEAIPKRSQTALAELQYPARGYKLFAKELSLIPVPEEMQAAHLKIVNGYGLMSQALTGMQKLFIDPVNGAGAYQTYAQQRILVTTGYAELLMLTKKFNIIFTTNEPGFIFNRASSTPSTN